MDEWITSKANAKARERLIKKCNEALNIKRFQRDFYGKGKTACNMGTEWILKQMGRDTQILLSYWAQYDRFIPGTANYMYFQLLDSSCQGIVKEINWNSKEGIEQEVHRLGWMGCTVVGSAHSEVKGRSGHIAIVYPTPQNNILKVCNIGWDNLVCSPHDKKSFGGGKAYLSEIKYFLLTKLEE